MRVAQGPLADDGLVVRSGRRALEERRQHGRARVDAPAAVVADRRRQAQFHGVATRQQRRARRRRLLVRVVRVQRYAVARERARERHPRRRAVGRRRPRRVVVSHPVQQGDDHVRRTAPRTARDGPRAVFDERRRRPRQGRQASGPVREQHQRRADAHRPHDPVSGPRPRRTRAGHVSYSGVRHRSSSPSRLAQQGLPLVVRHAAPAPAPSPAGPRSAGQPGRLSKVDARSPDETVHTRSRPVSYTHLRAHET